MHCQLILASASPRRRALLEQLGVCYRVAAADIDETRMPNEPPGPYALRIAMEKALTVRGRDSDALPILAADTTVVVDGVMLGKPRDASDAAAMLRRLSGRTHEVLSAVVLLARGREPASALNVSRVTFALLREDWIEAYCATGEPLDKAGAYGVQGVAASRIQRLEGSFSGVMGLPLFEVAELLDGAGIQLLPRAGRH